ncbi:transposase [Salinibacter ruber M8]|uniref:Transposase n=1 Tax=Salinibacter ruber (strain M8) TaxID=761659 RepID=D5H6H6_SALRM|nr:transposase [Salinibacter ruber M8]
MRGKRADKRIADEEDYRFPDGTTLYQDKGFQGYNPPGATPFQPKKKPKGRKLTEEETAENSAINAVRVKAEHAIGGVGSPPDRP